MAKSRDIDSGEAGEGSQPLSTPLPTITHLQFLVIDLIRQNSIGVAAARVKAGVSELSGDYGGPKFYQLMRRMIEAGLVTSETQSIPVAAASVERTFYNATKEGADAHRKTLDFYETRRKLSEALIGTSSKRKRRDR